MRFSEGTGAIAIAGMAAGAISKTFQSDSVRRGNSDLGSRAFLYDAGVVFTSWNSPPAMAPQTLSQKLD